MGVNGLRMLELGLNVDGLSGLNHCAEELVGSRPKYFFASSGGPNFEVPTLDGIGKEGSVSLEPMGDEHILAHPRDPSNRVFKALFEPRASIPCLLENEKLGAKEVEKVSYVEDDKRSDYSEGVSESKYHLLSILPYVGDDRASSSSPLSVVLARERSVEAVVDVDLLKVMWVDRWPSCEGPPPGPLRRRVPPITVGPHPGSQYLAPALALGSPVLAPQGHPTSGYLVKSPLTISFASVRVRSCELRRYNHPRHTLTTN